MKFGRAPATSITVRWSRASANSASHGSRCGRAHSWECTRAPVPVAHAARAPSPTPHLDTLDRRGSTPARRVRPRGRVYRGVPIEPGALVELAVEAPLGL